MTDSPSDPDVGPGMPRWVKVFGIIALVLLILVVGVLLFGPGDHGPALH